MTKINRRAFGKQSVAVLGGVAAWGTVGGLGAARGRGVGERPGDWKDCPQELQRDRRFVVWGRF